MCGLSHSAKSRIFIRNRVHFEPFFEEIDPILQLYLKLFPTLSLYWWGLVNGGFEYVIERVRQKNKMELILEMWIMCVMSEYLSSVPDSRP